MIKTAEGLRSAELTTALERAVAGDRTELYRRLELQSGLPGPRANMALASAFAHECARIGPKVDALAYAMASLPPDEARGASGKEFLVVCGVLAVAARAAVAGESAARDEALALLEERADDPRFRVRDAVPQALATIGSKMKGELTERVLPWMDRYFHAAAVVRALAEPAWLEALEVDGHAAPIGLLHDAFVLAHDAPRSASRYPGHKALVEALGSAPKALARRFGVPMFDRLGVWAAQVKVPELREAILSNLDDPRLKRPFGREIDRIKELVEASKTPPRDPTLLRHGMRGRGKKRSQR